MLVTVTYLKPKSMRAALELMRRSNVVARQAAVTEGYLGGRLAIERRFAFWTVTSWADGAALARFRDSGAHADAVPRQPELAASSAFVTWHAADGELPGWDDCYARVAAHGVQLPAKRGGFLSRGVRAKRRTAPTTPSAGDHRTARSAPG